MLCLKIHEVKQFMALLFTNSYFDDFMTREAHIQTFTDFTFSGKKYVDFYTEEEVAELEQEKFVRWGELRGLAFQIIKGKRTPSVIKLVFQATEHMLEGMQIQVDHNEVDALFVNLRYENNELTVITGVSKRGFSLDKSMDHAWDDAIKRFLKTGGVVFSDQTTE